MGGWAQRVLAVPGANGPEAPFGEAWAVELHTVSGWSDFGSSLYDFGAITLDADIGLQTGTFGLSVESRQELLSQEVGITGYPGDKTVGSQWQTTGHLTDLDERLLYSTLDVTYGSSGGPVWIHDGSGYFVVGIVTAGAENTNLAIRITEPVFSHLVEWAEEGLTNEPSRKPTPAPPPESAAAPATIRVEPGEFSGEAGEELLAIVTIGAHEGAGDLTVTASSGALIANAFLTPASCGGGSSECTGAPTNWESTVILPDGAGNDISTVLLTLGGTVEETALVVISASQGSDTWSTTAPVTLHGDDGGIFTAYGTGLDSGQEVEAWIDSRLCASTVSDLKGNWFMPIPSDAPCAPTTGAELQFTLDGEPTPAVEQWEPGGAPADVAEGVHLEVSDDPESEDRPGGFTGTIATSGVSLVVYGGGTLEQIERDAREVDAISIVVTVRGEMIPYIVGALEFVNADFETAFPTGVSTETPVLIRV